MAEQETKDTKSPTGGAREPAESNVLKDQFGNEHPWDGEKYPEGSAAREGNITRPSGTGGITPKSRPDYQDMFPANPPPSESANAKAEELDKVTRGEVSPVNPDGVDRPATSDTKTTKTTTKETTK